MLRRLLAAILACALPLGEALALPEAPTQAGPYTVTGALLDQVSKSALSPQAAKAQGLGGFNLSFHDDAYQYALPLCADAGLVEVDGQSIEPKALAAGDALVVTVRPTAAASAKSCADRIVRQSISRATSGGECLQDYQVKHEIEGAPGRLVPRTSYTYLLTVYARPTLDCDGKTYGAAPITTVIAPNKPFVITLMQSQSEIKRWSLSTDGNGKARLSYTFQNPSDDYKFLLSPAVATAGDAISWGADVVDPTPSPSATPQAAAKSTSPWSLVLLAVIILLGAGGAGYWQWRRRREFESPEDEYKHTPKL